MFDIPELLSNQSFDYESRRSLARHEYLQGSQQQFFIIVFFSIRYQTLISDIDTFLLALFIVSLDLKHRAPTQAASPWLFVRNVKKYMEEYRRVLYRKLASRNG